MITSNQNPRLKLARSLLGRAKERRAENAFVAEGVRLVEEALRAGWPFRFVLAAENLSDRGKALVDHLQKHGVAVEQVSSDLLNSISETETSQGILAVLDQSTQPIPDTLSCILILDQIRDPGNLGTLLRTAAAAGIQAIFLPPETADAFAPKVVRAGMGAHFRLPIHVLAWETIREICERANLTILLADMEGRSCWEFDLRSPLALIVGGEADGASQQARSLTDDRISIPMPGGGESLNAAVAGAILMFEVVRQRTSSFQK
jgi:TrmH family RNA methyltransferase